MATKDDKLVIRIAPGIKRRIESTAKKQNKTVSDFVRDIIVLFLDKEEIEYQNKVIELRTLLQQKELVKYEIYNKEIDDSNLKQTEELLMQLARLEIEIHSVEKYLNDYLNSKDIK